MMKIFLVLLLLFVLLEIADMYTTKIGLEHGAEEIGIAFKHGQGIREIFAVKIGVTVLLCCISYIYVTRTEGKTQLIAYGILLFLIIFGMFVVANNLKVIEEQTSTV